MISSFSILTSKLKNSSQNKFTTITLTRNGRKPILNTIATTNAAAGFTIQPTFTLNYRSEYQRYSRSMIPLLVFFTSLCFSFFITTNLVVSEECSTTPSVVALLLGLVLLCSDNNDEGNNPEHGLSSSSLFSLGFRFRLLRLDTIYI